MCLCRHASGKSECRKQSAKSFHTVSNVGFYVSNAFSDVTDAKIRKKFVILWCFMKNRVILQKQKNNMPTIFILFGYIFKFYSDDHEPIQKTRCIMNWII